jgi:AraC-like DNA-binding protein
LFRDCPTLFLKELAAPFKYSEYYLSRKFSQEMGVGLKDYIRRQRLEQAKALLKDTDLEICEVSDRLRFCSPSYFSEQFKSEYGVSPTQL